MARKIGVLVGALVGFLLAMAILYFVYRGRSYKEIQNDYDERQMIARGECFRSAFFAGITYYLLAYLYGFSELPQFMDTAMTVLLGVVLMMGVFAVKAIIKDAYMGLHENVKVVSIVGVVVGLFNIIIPILRRPKLIVDGVLTGNAGNYVLGVMIIFVFVFYFIYEKVTSSRRSEEEEDADEEP